MKQQKRPAAYMVVCALLAVLFAASNSTAYAEEIRVPTAPVKGGSLLDINFLEPLRNALTGRAWLLAEGLDPGLQSRPDWSTLTKMAWESIDNAGGGGLAGFMAPTLQAAGGFLVPYRSPAPAFSRDILISRDFSGFPIQTEPHIAVHPDDPDHLIVAMIDYNFPSNTSYVSLDGGQTWEGPQQTGYLPDDMVSGGDPVLGFDRDGNAYLASISIGIEEFSIGPVFTSSMVSSIAVARSTDGGFTWPQIISTARSDVTISEQQIDPTGRLRGNVSVGFLDKPWMSIGPSHEDPSKDVIYVGYVDFVINYDIIYMGELPILLPREMTTTIQIVKSEDRGLTWSDPVAASPTVRRVFGEITTAAPGMFGTNRVLQGGRPAVGPDGTLYVAWVDSTDDGSMEGLGEYYITRSTDGGETFSTPEMMVVFNELPFRPRNAFFRYWGSQFPRLEAAPNGDLYVVYSARPVEKPNDDGDIFFLRSTDGGRNWTRPRRLNADEGSALQFFPEIAIAPDGTIHVMWADMRDDPSQIKYHIYTTKSTDGGRTWGYEIPELGIREGDARVSDFASNPNRGFPSGLFIGDYFGIAATTEDVYMVWADSRLAEYGGVNQKIAFARQRAIRRPDIFVSPSAGAGGENITIQGFNFQPDMSVIIQLGDAAISSARTNPDGRFTAGIYIPVTGEGAQDIMVYDESGNFASTSFYTEFGFGSIGREFQTLLEEIRSLRDEMRR